MELPLLRARSKFSLEAIEYQNDNFGSDMELIIGSLQKKILDNVYADNLDVANSNEVRDLTNIIMDRFGLLVQFVVDNRVAAVLPFYANRNHIFIDKYFRGLNGLKSQQDVLAKSHNKKGTVDLHKARVGGWFSECKNILFINFNYLFKVYKLSPAETVAVMLHELGHAFNAFEYSDRLETANQVLQDVAKRVTSKKDKGDSVYVYRQLKTINSSITEEEVDKLLSGTKVIGDVIWFKVIAGTVSEQLTNSKYSETSSEQLADSFMARFGYYRHFITGYEKGNLYGEMEKNLSIIKMNAVTQSLQFAVLATVTAATLPFSFLMSMFMMFCTFAFLRGEGEDVKDYTYDGMKVRYKRVRNEAVNRLKDLNYSADVVRPILDDIYFMDKVISETFTVTTPIGKLANFLFTSAKSAKASIAEQQLLEELAMNDLFIASAELRTLNT